jgi:hypothetical protein
MDAGLRLRLERGLLEQFMEACRADGRIAAQVLRTMIRDYVTRPRSGSAAAED